MAEKKESTTSKAYFEGIGRRKTAVARVRISEGKGGFVVNEKDANEYFYTEKLQKNAVEALKLVNLENKFSVSVHVKGSGSNAQSEAVRMGMARALIEFDEGLRDQLKRAGFLRRDPRTVERKKFGLKKARRSPQWTKR